MTLLKIVAATLVVVGIVVGFLELRYTTYSPPGEFTGPPAVASNGDWMASHLRHSDSVHRARFPGELSMIAAIYARKERPRSEENP
jgi:hypothetical protein